MENLENDLTSFSCNEAKHFGEGLEPILAQPKNEKNVLLTAPKRP